MVEPPIPGSFFEARAKEMLIFTYDVYMDVVRLHRYIPSAREPRVLRLPNFKLWFPKFFFPASSGLPSIMRAEGEDVWGIGWRASTAELPRFKNKLVMPNRYHMNDVRLTDRGGERLPGMSYEITQPDFPPSKPSKGKLEAIVSLGKSVGLPDEYLEKIGKIETLSEEEASGKPSPTEAGNTAE